MGVVIDATDRFVEKRRIESYQKERYLAYRRHLKQAAAHLDAAIELRRELGLVKKGS